MINKIRRFTYECFEGRRLRGQRVFVWIFKFLSPSLVLEISPKGPGMGGYLLAAKLREGPASSRTLLFLLNKYNRDPERLQISDHERRTIIQSIAHKTLTSHSVSKRRKILSGMGARLVTIKPISASSVNEHYVIYKPYKLVVNPFNVIHRDFNYKAKSPRVYQVGTGEIVTLTDCNVTVESDIFSSGDGNYVDVNQWKGSSDHNLINDSKILALNIERRKAILEEIFADPVFYDEVKWLGSPMLSSWGHFVYEGLLRLEILDRIPGENLPTIISSAVPEEFKLLAKLIFPKTVFIEHDPRQLVHAKMLRVAPLRSFTRHNLHFTKNGENLRLNGEPELFNAFRERVRSAVSTPTVTPKRVFLDRSNAKYRISRNQTRMRSIALEHGYSVIDPGMLSAREQLSLFLQVDSIWGQTGSGFFLAPLVNEGANVMMVGSDFSHDWDGLAQAIRDSAHKDVDLITGKRDFVAKGFSEGLYHQDFTLSEKAWSEINRWCSSH